MTKNLEEQLKEAEAKEKETKSNRSSEMVLERYWNSAWSEYRYRYVDLYRDQGRYEPITQPYSSCAGDPFSSAWEMDDD